MPLNTDSIMEREHRTLMLACLKEMDNKGRFIQWNNGVAVYGGVNVPGFKTVHEYTSDGRAQQGLRAIQNHLQQPNPIAHNPPRNNTKAFMQKVEDAVRYGHSSLKRRRVFANIKVGS